jgi:hypothetical protein
VLNQFTHAYHSRIVLPGSEDMSEATAQPITAAAWKAAADVEVL